MTNEEFEIVLNERLADTKQRLASKAGEYASGNNRMHNFEASGRMNDESREKALWGMMSKQIVAVKDMVDMVENDDIDNIELFQIDEKIGDTINYLILLEAMLIERVNNFLALQMQEHVKNKAKSLKKSSCKCKH